MMKNIHPTPSTVTGARKVELICAAALGVFVIGFSGDEPAQAIEFKDAQRTVVARFMLPPPQALPSKAKTNLGKHDVKVDFTNMKNAEVGALVGGYLGFRGKLPNSTEIDFASSLNKLWARKLRIKNVSPATQKTAASIVSRYANNPKDTKGIREFVATIDSVAVQAHSGIDFPQLCKKVKVDKNKCAMYSIVAGRLRGNNIAAYGMTELFPSKSGSFNYVLLDTVLRNAGENYLQSIPALGDKYLSFGFYQFTSFAVRQDAEHTEGANVVANASKYSIPGSVSALEGRMHHRAAYYFATYNLGRLIHRLNNTEANTLLSGACTTSQLTQFVAVAHHNPKHALRNAEKWIHEGCKKPLQSYLGPRLVAYAAKTAVNLKVLNERI